MKTLQVIESLGRGGAEQALVNLLPALQRRGHQCEVAALWPPYTLAEPLERSGVVVHRLNLSHRWNIVQGIARLAAICRRGRYDVVHAHLFFAGIYTALSRPFAPTPRRVVSFHNLGYDTYPAMTLWRKIRKHLDSWLMRHSMDGWIAVSATTAEHYAKHLKVTSITVIPVPVDLECLRPLMNGRERPSGRLAAYGVSPGEFSLILPARLVPEKGHRFLVKALELLRDRGLFPKTLLFGDGPLASEIAAEVDQHGLRDQVILHGALPNAELLPLVRDAHLVVMPSTNEGLPISALEAMALERPLVASRVGGLASLIEDQVSGVLVPPGNPGALAEGIAKLMADPELRKRLGRAARQRVEVRYSAEVVAAQCEAYYRNVLEATPRHRAAVRVAYLIMEIPRRLLRIGLCWLYGTSRWHVASSRNKPYIRDILAHLNSRALDTVVEVGCGFCDILSHLNAPRRIGYDADRRVIRAARVYAKLKCARVEIDTCNLISDGVPAVRADAWVLVNWLHEFSETEIRRPLRGVFARLDPGGLMILDTVTSASYQHHHDVHRLFEGLPCQISVISRDPSDSRIVFSVERTER